MADEIEPLVLDEQGILLFHLKQLTEGRSEIGIKNTVKPSDVQVQQANWAATTANSTTTDAGLSSICLIDTDNPSKFMNLLRGEPNINDALLRLTTFELSSLVPVIRIFKIYTNSTDNREVVLEIPFDTYAVGINDIYKSGLGMGDGAGLTSVNWKHNPKNEANINSYRVKLDIHLQNIQEFFKIRNSIISENIALDVSIQDLLYQRKTYREKTGEGTAIYDPDKYMIKMIVGWQISDAGLESLRQNNSRQEVELVIRALREQKDIMYLHFVSHTMEFMDNGSIDLSIDYHGRADMNSRQISTSNILTGGPEYDKEILKVKEKIKAEKEKVDLKDSRTVSEKADDAVASGVAIAVQIAANTALVGVVAATTVAIAQIFEDTELEKLQKELEALQAASKKTKFAFFTTQMLKKKQLHHFYYDENVLIPLLTNLKQDKRLTNLTSTKNIVSFNQATTAASSSTAGNSGIQTINSPAAFGPSAGLDATTAAVNLTAGQGRAATAATLAAPDAAETSNMLFELAKGGEFDKSVINYADRGNNKFKQHIAFFYVSSLIEAIMDINHDTNIENPNFINKKVRCILGPMTYTDYRILSDSGQSYKEANKSPDPATPATPGTPVAAAPPPPATATEEESVEGNVIQVYNGTRKVINIGDIPISYKDFSNWFNNLIVNKNKNSMSLSDFITSLIKDLFIEALTSDLYNGAPKQKTKFSIEHYTAITSPKNENAFLINIGNYKLGGRYEPGNNIEAIPYRGGGFRISLDALESLKTQTQFSERDHDSQNTDFIPSKDYMLIYSLSESPQERTGDYEKDKQDGIMHLYNGESKGTIRKLKFSRVDNPNRRTANLLAANANNVVPGKIIREKYNVNIELFGNTNFQAGTYIFLSPVYPGSGGIENTQVLLREIGLGGYYQITEVSNSIEMGDFKTEVKAVWVAFGDGTANDGEIQMTRSVASENSKAVVK